ncbi:MAG: preprotein translocase subunit SecG [Myxococcota bacterium]
MLAFFSTIHVLLCVFMIFVILLQPGKDAGMGAALGGGAATSAFGGRGAVTFLSKVTAASAVAFFLTSLGLSFVGLKSSVGAELGKEDAQTPPPASAPAVPGATPTAPAPQGSAPSTPAPEGAAPTAPTVPAPTAAPTAGQGDPTAAPGAPTPTEPKPGATDAVPAEKLPAKP